MVHMLLVVAVVSASFLIAVGRIIGGIGVDQDARRSPIAPTLVEVEGKQGRSQPAAGLPIDGILEAGECGLAGERAILGQTATGQLEEWVMPEGIGIILILVATGNLEEPLA